MDYKNFKYAVFESSPQAKAFIESYEDKKGVVIQQRGPNTFPWGQMKIGQSFIIPYDRIKKQVIRNLAAQKPKMTGKKFRVIEHDEHKLFEVVRIA